MTDDSEKPKRGLLQRLGLQEPSHQQDLDEWVQVASGRVDDPDTGFSARAAYVVDTLAAAGIKAQQRPYLRPENPTVAAANVEVMRPASERIRIAVLVHRRDADRAKELLGESDSGGR